MAMLLVGDWAPGNYDVRLPYRSDTYIANLEGPILENVQSFVPSPKAGPSLYQTCLPKDMFFTLANNHIMDYGLSGLDSSFHLLTKNANRFCGAGINLTEARCPLIVEENGVKIGIIACCEAQFGVAGNDRPGVAEFGPWVYEYIRDLKKETDIVLISCHAAVEEYPWPSPFIRELYQSYIDAGATIVHGHHAHVPQGFEEYGGGIIFYGMGNFAVDPQRWKHYPNGMWSLGARIDFRDKSFRWDWVTFEIRHREKFNLIEVEESTSLEKQKHSLYLEKCNTPLRELRLFESVWQEIALDSYQKYAAEYMGFKETTFEDEISLGNFVGRVKQLLRDMFDSNRTIKKRQYMIWYHMVACESHRQVLTTALGVLSGEIEDIRDKKSRTIVSEVMCLEPS